MAWTQADLDAAKAAFRAGKRSVSYGTGRIDYANTAELERIISVIAADLNRQAGTPNTRQIRFVARKGL